MQPEDNTNDILIDATMETNDKLGDIADSNEVQVQGIMETNDELNELNRTAEMILDQVAESKQVLDININGAEKVEITGPQGEVGPAPVKGKDYFTKQEIQDIIDRVQKSIKVPKDGVDGVTPIKGQEYFTPEEIEAFVNEVVSRIPMPKDGENAELDYDFILAEIKKMIPKTKDGKDGKDGSSDTPEQVKAKLLEAGIKYTDLKDAPVFQPASKTVSLKELDDVDLSGATITNGKYVISGGSAVDSVNSQTGVVVLDADDIDDTSTTHKFVTATDITKLGNISITQAVNLDTLESDTVTNNAKVTNATHTGEVTGATALTIANSAVTNAKMANMAQKTYKGRTTASTGAPEDVAVATLKTDLVLVKGDVGLGNVDNTSDATKNSATATLTNKRINPRLTTAASYTTNTGTSLDVSTCDQFEITAQAGALLFNAPSGTSLGGNKLIIRIKDNGTARALTYNAIFRAMGNALPSTTVLSKTLYMGFIYNATDTKWDLVALAQEA